MNCFGVSPLVKMGSFNGQRGIRGRLGIDFFEGISEEVLKVDVIGVWKSSGGTEAAEPFR